MGENNKKRQCSQDINAPFTTTSHSLSSDVMLPQSFPLQLPKPSQGTFLSNTDDFYKESFKAALATAYEGLVWDSTDDSGICHARVSVALDQEMNDYFRKDVTQPFGLGTKCAATYVTRCCVGDPGTTYKYLGLRMFAHSWDTLPDVLQELRTNVSERSNYYLQELKRVRTARGALATKGRSDFDICLINRMDASTHLKALDEQHKTAVSWHADSSLEHYSTIAVYQSLVEHHDNRQIDKTDTNNWSVAVRVAPHSEGPTRRATETISTEPMLKLSLPSGSTYFMLDDFNHHHQHAVLVEGSTTAIRYSCTFRLLRESHNVQYVLKQCATTGSQFHKKGAKQWRSEQLLLTHIESEWIRQFYVQGKGNRDLLWASWREPIQQLLQYWSQLEERTHHTIQFLKLAMQGKCYGETESPTRAERKARMKRKKAFGAMEDLLERGGTAQEMYDSFAECLEERATMREQWDSRERDHVFHTMPQDCRPLAVPFLFDSQQSSGPGSSPLPGTPTALREIGQSLHAWGIAYTAGNHQSMPVMPSSSSDTGSGAATVSVVHAKARDWSGWTDFEFALELQSPWAEELLSGRKSIETRAYSLPVALLDRKIYVLESPQGQQQVSMLGNEFKLGSGANVVGWCIFKEIKVYSNKQDFLLDEANHLVAPSSGYGWKEGVTKVIYGWVVESHGRSVDVSFTMAIRRMRSLFQLSVKAKENPKTSIQKRKEGNKDRSQKRRKKRY
jgi:alpha-ketoglutarate-dependent dioxygenase FTO